MLRGRGGCYKHAFYGIESHRCMETTPSLACANKCVFCWRLVPQCRLDGHYIMFQEYPPHLLSYRLQIRSSLFCFLCSHGWDDCSQTAFSIMFNSSVVLSMMFNSSGANRGNYIASFAVISVGTINFFWLYPICCVASLRAETYFK